MAAAITVTSVSVIIFQIKADRDQTVTGAAKLAPKVIEADKVNSWLADGKDYPNGLKGEEIPRVAQIIAVADTFDAMYSDRPYRSRMNFDKAVSIIKDVAGTQLTEDVVEAFLRLAEKGELRAPDDVGGGSMEDISNIHKKQE